MMTIDKALRLARKWASGHVCTLREGEAQEYHQLCAEVLERSRWIPVEERLPEKEGYYLVWDETCEYSGEARFEYGEFTWISNENIAFASHWMPLPEKPDKEDNDG